MSEERKPNEEKKTIWLIAHAETGEITAWPTDAKHIRVHQVVEWQLYVQRGCEFPPTGLERLPRPFALKFSPGDGFDHVELQGTDGRAQTTARKQGVYHYEVAFTLDDRVFALFGCPSGTVER